MANSLTMAAFLEKFDIFFFSEWRVNDDKI